MTFGEAIKSVFSKYVTFSGRASRSEYWYYMLFLVIIGCFAGVTPSLTGPGLDNTPSFFVNIVLLALLLPTLAVSIRRLHDVDYSGWWWFVQIIPVVGYLFILYLNVQPGTSGSNRFGPDPISLKDKIVDLVGG